MNIMTKIVTIGTAAFLLIGFIIIWFACIGSVDAHEYAILQHPGGEVEVIDTPGYFWKGWGRVWEYPRAVQTGYMKHDKEGQDQSIRVTFNDGGRAQISTLVNFALPAKKEDRIHLHQTFGGSIPNIEQAVYAHLANCVKNTGPVMTSTENQTGRKSEFNQIVEDQLRQGQYEMRRREVVIQGQTDANGQPVKVLATEVITDDKGKAVISRESPLAEYGISIQQLSIIETEYDDLTQQQFKAKQEAFLAAERSKAQREQEIQQKLMVEAQGLRQAAEIQASSNLEKTKAVTAGQQKVEVALKDKEAAETAAAQNLAVAMKMKETAEVTAKQSAEVIRIEAENRLKIAQYNLEIAQKDADAKLTLAQATAKEIEVAGRVKDADRVLAEIKANRDVQVAQALSKISVPANIINAGATNGQDGDITKVLFNWTLLKNSGLLADTASQPAK